MEAVSQGQISKQRGKTGVQADPTAKPYVICGREGQTFFFSLKKRNVRSGLLVSLIIVETRALQLFQKSKQHHAGSAPCQSQPITTTDGHSEAKSRRTGPTRSSRSWNRASRVRRYMPPWWWRGGGRGGLQATN